MTGQVEQSESALVCAAQRGEKEAFRQLLTQNWPWLKALVYSVIHNTDGVDDVMQDICVQVIRKVNTLREPGRFRPWMAVLARRQALKYRQRKSQRRVISLNNDEVAGQQCDYKAGQLLDNLELREQYQQVLQAVKSLPEIYRQVFMLAHLEDLSYARIAEILDVPFTTVQIRLVRARRMIFNQIKDKEKNEV
ncbi:MAG: RNA polymerase sigma factor [Promethearchaeota archaeon]